MKNLIIGVVLGILLILAAIVWLVPPLTYDSLPFLWSGHHKKLIHDRAQELIDALAKDDTEAAIKLTDPNLVMQRGTGIVGVQFKVLGGLVRLAGKDNIRIDDVALGPDSKTAEVKLSHRRGSDWKAIDPSKWVRVNGKWYVTF